VRDFLRQKEPNEHARGSFSLTAQNIMSRAMSLVLTKSIQTKEKE